MVASRSEPAHTPPELTASLLSQFSSPTFSTPGGLARARASFFGRLSKYSVILLSWLIYAYAGETWTSRTAAEANTWMSVTNGGGLFVAVSADGTNRVMTAPAPTAAPTPAPTPAVSSSSSLSAHDTAGIITAFATMFALI